MMLILPQKTKWSDSLLFAFSGVTLLLLFIGPFYWPGTDTSLVSSVRITLLLALFAAVVSRHWPVLTDTNLLVFMLFWLYLFLNACFFDNVQIMRRLAVILAFVYVLSIPLKDAVFCRRLLSIIVGVISFCALFSIAHHIALGEFSFGYRATPISGSGLENFAEFYNTIDAGTYYAPSLAFSIWLALTSNRRIAAIGWALCAFVIAVFIYFTFARTVWLASMAFMLVLLRFSATPQVRKMVFFAIGALLLIVMALSDSTISYELDRGLSQRDEIWKDVLSRMPGHWIIGHGAGTSPGPFSIGNETLTVWHIHNLYLQVLYQFGLIGLLLMLVTSAACIVKLFRMRTNTLAALWLAVLSGGLLAMFFAMNNFVGAPNRIWIYFWLPVAGCLALSRDNAKMLPKASPSHVTNKARTGK
jgi:O-antigen ligase